MGYFEYVMVLISIIIGLALTHILTALGSAVHRLRGHGPPIKLDAIYLTWIVSVLLMLVSFWWTEFKFQDSVTEWTFGLYLFLVALAISLFLLAVVLVPPGMKGVDDSYEYFMAGRRWFFGTFFVVTVLDLVDTSLKGVDWVTPPNCSNSSDVNSRGMRAGIEIRLQGRPIQYRNRLICGRSVLYVQRIRRSGVLEHHIEQITESCGKVRF